MTPHLWVVVPTCREAQVSWVLKLLASQTMRDFRVCIVENGEAVGACKRLGVAVDLVVTSDPHVSSARNAGVSAIRTIDRDAWIAMIDDDDWYSPHYLEEVRACIASGKASIYGKQRHFVAHPDHGLILFANHMHDQYVPDVHGPSIVFRVADAMPFPVQSEAEELQWCASMRAKGARVWSSSIYHLLYLRYTSAHHTWGAQKDIVFMASAKGASFHVLGNVDLDIVTGAKPWAFSLVQEVSPPALAVRSYVFRTPRGPITFSKVSTCP